MVKGCTHGTACGYPVYECVGCSFEQCRDRAISKNSYAFSYRGTEKKWCYMCDKNQVKQPWFHADWGIYTKSDKGIFKKIHTQFYTNKFFVYNKSAFVRRFIIKYMCLIFS